VAVEGAAPPRVNGEPVTADGTPLNLGDLLEVAGAELKVVLAGGRESL
jgi:hypothetical protein